WLTWRLGGSVSPLRRPPARAPSAPLLPETPPPTPPDGVPIPPRPPRLPIFTHTNVPFRNLSNLHIWYFDHRARLATERIRAVGSGCRAVPRLVSGPSSPHPGPPPPGGRESYYHPPPGGAQGGVSRATSNRSKACAIRGTKATAIATRTTQAAARAA